MSGGVSKRGLATPIGFKIKLFRGGGLVGSLTKPVSLAATTKIFSKRDLAKPFSASDG